MATRTYRRYSTEFKLQLVRAYLSGEGGFKTIARRHNLCPTLLRHWVAKHRAGEITEQVDQSERLREAEAKVATLERKIGQLVMEVDLLKKGAPRMAQRGDPPSIVSGPLAGPSKKRATP